MYWDGVNPLRMLKKDRDMFYRFYFTAATRMTVLKFTGHKLRNKIYTVHIVHNQNKGNEILKEMILSGEPFMFGRHGTTELNMAGNALMLKTGVIDHINLDKLIGTNHCNGFFPCTEENLIRFHELICEASEACDLYGTFRMLWEDYYIRHYMRKDVKLTHLNMMDFWRYKIPFTYALKGKKVLVVHPMVDLMERQYKNREHIFTNQYVLPEFQLSTVKAIQTIGENRDERFESWFDALDYMTEEVKKQDFDVALLGCGAYGMPLAARIKKMGKGAIYMGGVLQMLFGIAGSRWDTVPQAAAMYNEYWTRPGADLKPKGFEKVEDGCYW